LLVLSFADPLALRPFYLSFVTVYTLFQTLLFFAAITIYSLSLLPSTKVTTTGPIAPSWVALAPPEQDRASPLSTALSLAVSPKPELTWSSHPATTTILPDDSYAGRLIRWTTRTPWWCFSPTTLATTTSAYTITPMHIVTWISPHPVSGLSPSIPSAYHYQPSKHVVRRYII